MLVMFIFVLDDVACIFFFHLYSKSCYEICLTNTSSNLLDYTVVNIRK